MSTHSGSPLVQLLRHPKQGLHVGERLEIPSSAIGVIVTQAGVALDRLPPGTFEVSAQCLPQMFQHLRLKPVPGTRAAVAVFAVYPAGSRMVQWGTEFGVTNAEYPGLNVGRVMGRVQYRVAEPGLFIAGLLGYGRQSNKGLNAVVSFRLSGPSKPPLSHLIATLDQNAEALLAGAIGDMAANVAHSTLATPVDMETARMQVQYHCQGPVTQWMQQSGMHLEGFSVDALPTPEHAPCCKCGSRTAPTARATFHRLIGLIYLRLHWRFDGNYCLPCGLKTGITETAILLVCGWWGFISFIMTPILILINLYQMAKLGMSHRRPSTTGQGDVSQSTYLGTST